MLWAASYVLVGILLCLIVEMLVFLWCYLYLQRLMRGDGARVEAPADEASEDATNDWPPNIKQFLSELMPDTKSKDEQWLNALVHRYWVELRKSRVFQLRMRHKILTKLRQRLIGHASSMVHNIQIDQLELGDTPPMICSARLIQTKKLDVIVEFDLEWQGGARVSAVVTATPLALKVPVSIEIGALAG